MAWNKKAKYLFMPKLKTFHNCLFTYRKHTVQSL